MDDLLSFLNLKREKCYLTKDFLEQREAAPTRYLDEFLTNAGLFRQQPEDLVFWEQQAKLVRLDWTLVTEW